MKTGRPKAPLALTAEEVPALQRLVTARSMLHGVATDHQTAQPVVWTATADSRLEKVRRLCEHISETLR